MSLINEITSSIRVLNLNDLLHNINCLYNQYKCIAPESTHVLRLIAYESKFTMAYDGLHCTHQGYYQYESIKEFRIPNVQPIKTAQRLHAPGEACKPLCIEVTETSAFPEEFIFTDLCLFEYCSSWLWVFSFISWHIVIIHFLELVLFFVFFSSINWPNISLLIWHIRNNTATPIPRGRLSQLCSHGNTVTKNTAKWISKLIELIWLCTGKKKPINLSK